MAKLSMHAQSSSRLLRVGMIGCGNISKAYFKHTLPFSDHIKTVAPGLPLGKLA